MILRLFLVVLIVPVSIISQYQPVYNQPYPPPYPPVYASSGLGNRDYGDECIPENNPYSGSGRGGESQSCDLSRGLTCIHFKCLCLVPGAIYRNGKCRARVGRSCEGIGGNLVECVINAECNAATRFCSCRRNYWSNDEGTACNHASQSVKLNRSFHYLFFLTAIFSLFYHHYRLLD